MLNVETAIKGEMELFDIEKKNNQTALQNLIQKNYSLDKSLKICWNNRETQKWQNKILVKFLNHPNSKHKPDALYDAFIKTNVLNPEHILALAHWTKKYK